MPWTRAVLTMALVAAVACLALAPTATAAPPIVEKVNKARKAHGLPPLRYSRSLGRSSERFARHLMKVDRFGHAPRIWASGRFSTVGECLAMTPGWRPRRSWVVRSWLRSPSHRAIVLSRAFNRVGAGVARGRFHGRPKTIWVAHFGRR